MQCVFGYLSWIRKKHVNGPLEMMIESQPGVNAICKVWPHAQGKKIHRINQLASSCYLKLPDYNDIIIIRAHTAASLWDKANYNLQDRGHMTNDGGSSLALIAFLQ